VVYCDKPLVNIGILADGRTQYISQVCVKVFLEKWDTYYKINGLVVPPKNIINKANNYFDMVEAEEGSIKLLNIKTGVYQEAWSNDIYKFVNSKLNY